MRSASLFVAFALALSGCTTAQVNNPADLTNKDTRNLCRIVAENPDQSYRAEAADLLVRRGADIEKCRRLIEADNAMMTGIAVAGAATAAGAAAHNGYNLGGYDANRGVAWDQFSNGQWRCRERATGRFAPDYKCAHLARVDAWP